MVIRSIAKCLRRNVASHLVTMVFVFDCARIWVKRGGVRPFGSPMNDSVSKA